MNERVTVAVVNAAIQVLSQVTLRVHEGHIFVHDQDTRDAAKDLLIKLFKLVEV